MDDIPITSTGAANNLKPIAKGKQSHESSLFSSQAQADGGWPIFDQAHDIRDRFQLVAAVGLHQLRLRACDHAVNAPNTFTLDFECHRFHVSELRFVWSTRCGFEEA